MNEQDVIDRIQSLCAARKWTTYRLAKESGITYSTLCTMLHKATSPSVTTLIKLCRGFGITLSEFFDVDGGWATLSTDQKALLDQWSHLSQENQQAALNFIRYLLSVQEN